MGGVEDIVGLNPLAPRQFPLWVQGLGLALMG